MLTFFILLQSVVLARRGKGDLHRLVMWVRGRKTAAVNAAVDAPKNE